MTSKVADEVVTKHDAYWFAHIVGDWSCALVPCKKEIIIRLHRQLKLLSLDKFKNWFFGSQVCVDLLTFPYLRVFFFLLDSVLPNLACGSRCSQLRHNVFFFPLS